MPGSSHPLGLPDVTQILSRIEAGEVAAADQLLPLVYDELRKLATLKLAQERSGQTLQATALVHEAYLRLVGDSRDAIWKSSRHFFAAAAEAMRRILVENARRRQSLKRGGQCVRIELDDALAVTQESHHELIELDELIEKLSIADPQAAELVKLRFYAGLTGDQAAAALGISPRSGDLLWAFARSWLFDKLRHERD